MISKKIYFSLTGVTTLCQSGPESNGNEWVLYTAQKPRTGVSSQDAV